MARPKRGRRGRALATGHPFTVTDVTGTQREPKMSRQNPPGKLNPWNKTNAGPVTVTLSGPLFDGVIPSMVDDMLAEMMGVTAAQGYADVMRGLNEHIQFPTPYYETQINIAVAGKDLVVNDRNIVYGPWLEGVSSRNQSTKFKGYHAFRRAADELRRRVPTLIAPVAARWLSRMGG